MMKPHFTERIVSVVCFLAALTILVSAFIAGAEERMSEAKMLNVARVAR